MHGPIDTWFASLSGALVVAAAWACVWSAPAIALRRNDLADVAWGLEFPLLALLVGGAMLVFDPHAAPRAALVLALVTVWGVRLALHIGLRLVGSDREDHRYAALREQWGDGWVRRSLLQVFALQGLIVLVVAQPVLIAVAVQDDHPALGPLDLVGAVLVLVGIVLEATADLQLAAFRRRRAAGLEQRRYLTSGTWAWSRHPNYAGDAITWCGFALIGVGAALDAGAPLLVVPALLGPALMVWLLRFGSGVAMSERGRAGTPEWDTYAARTSTFVPRPPRRAPE
jgi:steroid 5-alpha reductase family enzyme